MNAFVFWLAEKSLEIALGKLIEKLLSDSNIKQVKNFLKLQILLLCLDWVLLKTPLEPRACLQTRRSPQPPLKRGENERQSPPVLLEVLGKQSYTQNSSAF
jgi:hypothetical protein